ncbi:DNA-binding protein [Bacteroides clarus]|uniref:DNA-binding protein n=1 Tax=Bacteroides clarus TaxID=626929 RepID=UPI00248F31BC|nr:DNA-binding protein [Bacteroides clarus]
MYIDNEHFDKWMERLSKKLSEIGQDLKSLINTDNVLDPNDKLLANQDLEFLLKVSFHTLQQHRASGKLSYFTISHKPYYRAPDIRAFVQENANCKTYERFKKENQLDTQTNAKQGG